MNYHPPTTATQSEAQLLTIVEACHRLSIGRSTLYYLISKGKLPLRKIGGASRIRLDELEAFIQSLPQAPTASVEAD